MACFGKNLCFFFILVLVSSIQIQARESKFFNKFTRYGTENNVKQSKVPQLEKSLLVSAPTLSPEPAPAPVYTKSHSGLFGPGSGLVVPEKRTTTTATSDENELLNQELDAATYENGYQSSHYNKNGYSSNYNNNGYTSNNNNGYKLAGESYVTGNQNTKDGYTSNYYNNGYETERQGMSDTRFMEGGKYYYDVNNEKNYYPADKYESGKVSAQNRGNGYSNNYNNNGYKLASSSYETGNQNTKNGYTTNYNNNGYTSNYNNNGYDTDRQGMSDTRFMENGKYYYDVKPENNFYSANEYKSAKESTHNQGYYGNNQFPNEFNTMEEYEKYEESQERTVP